jgi:hypothetical protein
MQQETRKIDGNDAVRASAPTGPDACLIWSSQRQRGVSLITVAVFRDISDAFDS